MRARAVRRTFLTTAIGLASIALGGCHDAHRHQVAPRTSAPSADVRFTADWHHLGHRGYIYFHASTDNNKHYELFRTDLATGQTDQVTDLPGPFGVSNFSVSSGGLVVADASTLIDQAAWLRPGGTLARLPGPRALGPSINDRGDVLASIEHGSAEDLAVLRKGTTHWRRIVQGITGWTVSWWWDDQTAILLRIGKGRTTWQTIGVDGSESRRRAVGRGARPSSMSTHDHRPVLMTASGPNQGVLWTPGHKRRRLPRGWHHGCLSPDGQRILFMRNGVFGTIDVDHLSGAVQEIGSFDAKILGCGWVEEKFGP